MSVEDLLNHVEFDPDQQHGGRRTYDYLLQYLTELDEKGIN